MGGCWAPHGRGSPPPPPSPRAGGHVLLALPAPAELGRAWFLISGDFCGSIWNLGQQLPPQEWKHWPRGSPEVSWAGWLTGPSRSPAWVLKDPGAKVRSRRGAGALLGGTGEAPAGAEMGLEVGGAAAPTPAGRAPGREDLDPACVQRSHVG
ncbi:Inactive Phospholipase C-Like Protein 1 [Manis pentadactyla]|nr:Inactive Phospholipase C-Like Protein 1 [Manis pentadactyla]